MNLRRTFALALAALAVVPVAALAAAPAVSEAETKAISLLDARLHREALYDGRVEKGCASHMTSPSKERGWIDVDLYEEHNARCGGDPQTYPVIDRFRVQVGSGTILWYDVAEDEYLAFENVCRRRPCAQSKAPK